MTLELQKVMKQIIFCANMWHFQLGNEAQPPLVYERQILLDQHDLSMKA